MTTPAFLLSLPRAGSTLLQRMLANHPDVATAPEPWVLLPMIYGHNDAAAPAEYDESIARPAVESFLARVGAGPEVLRASGTVSARARALYEAGARGRAVFLDKTPRYALIASPIARAFPASPIVVLWRDPLAVYASIRETWAYERTGIARHEIDLYASLAGLDRAIIELGTRALVVRFERLVTEPEREMRRVCAHLGLAFDRATLAPAGPGADATADPALGDQTGRARHAGVEGSRARVDLNRALCNPTRVRWCRRWVEWIGDERLRRLGEDPGELRARLDAVRFGVRRVVSDLKRERRARAWRAQRRELIGRDALEAAEAIARGRWAGGG